MKIKIYKTIILPVVLYGCEAWPHTLREDRRPRVFENMILRRIFVSKCDANGEWRRLYNEELRILYRSPNIVSMIMSKRLRWAGRVARMKDGRSSFKIWSSTPRPLGRPKCRGKDDIKIYKTIILPVVLYGCEAWSLTLREEC